MEPTPRRRRGLQLAAVGTVGGLWSGLFGVSGGAVMVPLFILALTVALGLSQIRAEATSLLAIVPVAALGAWRQHRHGNVDVRAGMIVGALSGLGVLAGVALANAVPQEALKKGFAVVALVITASLARDAIASIRAGRAA